MTENEMVGCHHRLNGHEFEQIHGVANSRNKLNDWTTKTNLLRFKTEQDGGGVGGCGVLLSPQINQEYTFRHRSACRTPAESRQEYLTSGKEYIEPYKTREDEGTRGKSRSVGRTGPALGGWGNWRKGPIPTSGQLSESEEKHLRLSVKQLICGSRNGMRIRQSLLQPYIPQTGT